MKTYFNIAFAFLLLAGCHSANKKTQQPLTLQDSDLIKQTTYVPLAKTEAYAIINQYILPYLDSTSNGRQLYIHPLLLPKLAPPSQRPVTNTSTGDVVLTPPPQIEIDTLQVWDTKLLGRVKIINDADLKDFGGGKWQTDTTYSTRWRKKFGFGYMCISYPAYNEYSGLLIVRLYSEDDTGCGNGRDYNCAFVKTNSGWKFLYRNGN